MRSYCLAIDRAHVVHGKAYAQSLIRALAYDFCVCREISSSSSLLGVEASTQLGEARFSMNSRRARRFVFALGYLFS